jgi:hypothetical protein
MATFIGYAAPTPSGVNVIDKHSAYPTVSGRSLHTVAMVRFDEGFDTFELDVLWQL